MRKGIPIQVAWTLYPPLRALRGPSGSESKAGMQTDRMEANSESPCTGMAPQELPLALHPEAKGPLLHRGVDEISAGPSVGPAGLVTSLQKDVTSKEQKVQQLKMEAEKLRRENRQKDSQLAQVSAQVSGLVSRPHSEVGWVPSPCLAPFLFVSCSCGETGCVSCCGGYGEPSVQNACAHLQPFPGVLSGAARIPAQRLLFGQGRERGWATRRAFWNSHKRVAV